MKTAFIGASHVARTLGRHLTTAGHKLVLCNSGATFRAFCCASFCLLVGCGKDAPPPAGPLEVGVIVITTAPVLLTQELPGRVNPFFDAPVDARVSGIVLKRCFVEGALVKQGQLLYQIDPAPYEASLKTAQGTLASAQANVISSRLKAERDSGLVASGAVVQQDYDNDVATYHAYEANVLSDQGSLQTAAINLSYTRVISPISGRIGISQVTEGAYVQDGSATLLATVQELDKVYVDVVRTSGEFLTLRRQIASGQLKADADGKLHVKLILEDGSEYPQDGILQLSDVTVSTTTSTVTVRSIFPNPREELLPGMFVRARLAEGIASNAILVPQLAVTHNIKGEPTAFVVGPDGKADLRVLQTSRAIGNQWLISNGLQPGDQLIVDNLQKLQPGMAVKSQPAKLPPEYLAAAQAAK
jgi:membrane fusion protein (multidrug efflux system)